MEPRVLEASDGQSPRGNAQDFPLFAGGPLFQLLFQQHLSATGLVKLRKGVIAIVPLITWAPLLLLSAVNGRLFSGTAAIPFLSDLEVHVRLLLALPLLIVAEVLAVRRMRPVLQHFLDGNLIPNNAAERVQAAVASAFRLRNSWLVEGLLIAFVYGVGSLFIWRQYIALDATAWYATSSVGGSRLTPAGMWYGFVSLPIFQFLLCRWYFRLFLWARFLWQMSRIELSLIPTHPDRLGGLHFLSETSRAFTMLAAAHGTLLAGYIATRVLVVGTALTEFKSEIAMMVAFVLCITLGPLLTFSTQLRRTKRKGLREYGLLATRYVSAFDSKWLRGGVHADDKLLGTADLQSLADLGNSYNVVRSMHKAYVTKDDIIRFGVATLIPIVPLLLTMMPMEDLVKKLISILLK